MKLTVIGVVVALELQTARKGNVLDTKGHRRKAPPLRQARGREESRGRRGRSRDHGERRQAADGADRGRAGGEGGITEDCAPPAAYVWSAQ